MVGRAANDIAMRVLRSAHTVVVVVVLRHTAHAVGLAVLGTGLNPGDAIFVAFFDVHLTRVFGVYAHLVGDRSWRHAHLGAEVVRLQLCHHLSDLVFDVVSEVHAVDVEVGCIEGAGDAQTVLCVNLSLNGGYQLVFV